MNELKPEDQDRVLKLINGDMISKLNNEFPDLSEDGALLNLAAQLPSIKMGDVIIHSRFPKITKNNYDEKLSLIKSSLTKITENNYRLINSTAELLSMDIELREAKEFIGEPYLQIIEYIEQYIKGDVEEIGDVKISSALQQLGKFTNKYRLENKQSRESIYDHWNEVYLSFLDVEQINKNIKDKEAETLIEVIAAGVDGPDKRKKVVDDFQNFNTELRNKLKGVKFPNYVIRVGSSGKKKQEVDKFAALRLVDAFLNKFLGRGSEEYRLLFGDKEKVEFHESVQVNETREGGTDVTSSPEMDVKDIEEERKEIEMVEQQIDPLTALSIYDKSDLLVNENIVNEFLSKLEKESSNLGFSEQVMELLNEDIKEFIDELKADIIIQDNYYFSILDDINHVQVMQDIYNIRYDYQYYEFVPEEEGNFKIGSLVIEDVSVSSYMELVKRINEDTVKMMETIAEMVKLEKEVQFIENRAKTGPGKSAYIMGGNLPTYSGKKAIRQEHTLSRLIDFIEDFYINSLDPSFLFDKDAPEFTKNAAYKSMKSISQASRERPVSRIKEDLISFGEINMDKDMLSNLRKFFILIRRMSRLDISDESVLNIFEDAHTALVNMHMTASKTATGKSQIKEASLTYRNLLGRILIEIGENNGYSMEAMGEIQFKRRPVSSYDNAPIGEIDNIFEILEEPELAAYAKKKEFYKELQRLISEIKTNKTLKIIEGEDINKAYINALDILKSVKGDTICKAYLQLGDIDDIDYIIDVIKKEDGVDIFVNDIEGIVESRDSYNTLSHKYGVSEDVIYKIKGLFRWW